MARLPCPNVETCGSAVSFTRYDEWDTNAHGVEIADQDCYCDLSADQVDALLDEATRLPLEEWGDG